MSRKAMWIALALGPGVLVPLSSAAAPKEPNPTAANWPRLGEPAANGGGLFAWQEPLAGVSRKDGL